MVAPVRLQDPCGCARIALFGGKNLVRLSSSFTHQSLQLQHRRLVPVAAFSSKSVAIDPPLQSQVYRWKTCLEHTLPTRRSSRLTERWICFAAGGKRPRRPHIWKSRHRRGSFNKAERLLDSLEAVSNVKEEVYGVLDGFVAWELDFPLITVKKVLTNLEREKNWPRIIQIIKWMLEKGQGRTMGTYSLFLKALSEEGRTEEAQELFKKVFSRNLECTPVELFAEIMIMYERHEMYEDILEVFADMEELNVRLDTKISGIVTRTYEKIGDMDRAYRVQMKYASAKFRWRMVNGKIMKFRNKEKDVAVQRWTRNQDSGDQAELDNSSATPITMNNQSSSEQSAANENHTTFAINDSDGMITGEDLSEYDSTDDKHLSIAEDEDFTQNGQANEVYFGRLKGRREIYLQNIS